MQLKKKKGPGLREFNLLGCPLTNNLSGWCFNLCSPDDNKRGVCGRIAPHALKGRTQLAIEGHNRKKFAEHLRKLENMYHANPFTVRYGIKAAVSEGAAELKFTVQKDFLTISGFLDSSLLYKLLNDAATLAVNSKIDFALVQTVNFNTYLTQPVSIGTLVAKSRFLSISESLYLAETLVTNQKGLEICRGNGAFVKSRIALSEKIGYK
jgi:acyl-coenzyme A thioesterase PaaI-like protein